MEVERGEEVTYGRTVSRHILIVFRRFWIRVVVAAASGQRFQLPVALDEFGDAKRGPCTGG